MNSVLLGLVVQSVIYNLWMASGVERNSEECVGFSTFYLVVVLAGLTS